jgi:hypothetical protein
MHYNAHAPSQFRRADNFPRASVRPLPFRDRTRISRLRQPPFYERYHATNLTSTTPRTTGPRACDPQKDLPPCSRSTVKKKPGAARRALVRARKDVITRQYYGVSFSQVSISRSA